MYTPAVILPLIGMPGPLEWVLIGLAVVMFFGATKLPKLGQGLGEGIRNFKKGLKGELTSEDEESEDPDKLPPKGDAEKSAEIS